MAVDILQDIIRKQKNPFVLELALPLSKLPDGFTRDGQGYGAFCLELIRGLKGQVGALRVSFAAFALLGQDGMQSLSQVLQKASKLGYYVMLDAPEIWSPAMAETVAECILDPESKYPCDGLVICGYMGSDVIKPFLPYCTKGKKDLFVGVRTGNKSAPEIQDLLAGSRLVHMAAADHVNRYGSNSIGKFGYTQVGVMAGASSAQGLQMIRQKYPNLFLLVDGLDYPNSNAKNCSFAFDRFGHGAAICVGTSVTCAWKSEEGQSEDFLLHAIASLERQKKNISRYVTIL